jgi:hypothetical protein
MVAPIILSILVGAAIAQRFKVLALVPAIVVTLLFALVGTLASAHASWTIPLTAVTVIIGLQIGYLLGLVVRHLVLSTRAGRPGPASPTSSLPPQWRAH